MGFEIECLKEMKIWVFGKNSVTRPEWGGCVGMDAVTIRFHKFDPEIKGHKLMRSPTPLIPVCIPDVAVFQEDFSFEWIEVTTFLHPDTPAMEVIARAAK